MGKKEKDIENVKFFGIKIQASEKKLKKCLTGIQKMKMNKGHKIQAGKDGADFFVRIYGKKIELAYYKQEIEKICRAVLLPNSKIEFYEISQDDGIRLIMSKIIDKHLPDIALEHYTQAQS